MDQQALSYDALGDALRRGAQSNLDAAALAALHVGLQLDAFAPEQLLAVVRVVHQHLGAPGPGATLCLRLRLVHSCRAFAIAARGHAEGIRDEDVERTSLLLDALVRDREPTVATAAAAVMGALASRSPRIANFLGQRTTPAHGRRVVAASVVQWALGDRADRSIDRVLTGIDGFGTAEAIRALGTWRASAPGTIDAAVLSLAKAGAPAEVLSAATDYALAVDEKPSRETLLVALRSVAMARATEPGLALWCGKRGERAWEQLEQARRLRTEARVSVARASAEVLRTFVTVESDIRWMRETESGASVLALDDALDHTFVTSSLLSDLLLATSAGEVDGSNRWRAWANAMLDLRGHRIGALQRAGRDRLEVREAARKLARALDATPKPVQHQATAHESPSAVLRDAHERLARNKDGLLDRSLARLFALAVELEPGGMPPVDALALMLPFPRKVLRHFASTFTLEGLELIVESIVALGGVIDEAREATAKGQPSRRVRKRLATDLEARLRELEGGVSALTDGPLSRGLDYVVRACDRLLHAEVPSEPIDAVLERGVEGVTTAVHETLARHEMRRPPTAGAPASGKRLRQLLLRSNDAPSQRGELAKMLPGALEGLLEAALALRGALDPESRGPPAGTVIGDYVVVRMLGSGGMGACVLAKPRSVRTAPQVVLKLPRRTTGMHRTLFRNEALALLQLAEAPHPGIVRFVAFNDGSGVPPHLVMEFVDGHSLEKRIAEKALSMDEALGVFGRLARAIAHAHGYRMGHYDIKPANVMLAKKLADTPVLVDWGIAGATFRASVGTPEYMAPERYEQEIESATAVASDVYALGCLVTEMVSREVLLGGPLTAADDRVTPGIEKVYQRMGTGSFRSILIAQMIAGDAALRQARVERALEAGPLWLTELVLGMVAEKPAARPTASAVVRRLESFGL